MNPFPKKVTVPLLFIFLAVSQLFAQQIDITQIQLKPTGEVVVSYDLKDEQRDRKYSLYLYSSSDNYIQPLELVTGHVGPDLAVGQNKQMVWNAKEELGADYVGDIALELKGNVYVPFIALDGFDDYKVFKRGKPYEVTWTGGRGDNVLNFEMYQGDTKVKVLEERPNVGNTTIIIPMDVKPGEYRFKISDKRNRDEVVLTETFSVKRQLPLGFKGLGVAAVGLLGSMAAGGGESGAESKIGTPPLPNN
jgi:hypothetical protein